MKLTNEAKAAIVVMVYEWKDDRRHLMDATDDFTKEMWGREIFADWRALRVMCELFGIDAGLVSLAVDDPYEDHFCVYELEAMSAKEFAQRFMAKK